MTEQFVELNHRYAKIDFIYQRYLNKHPEFENRWLLAQTLYTAANRRGIFNFLPVAEGARVLDVGTGFGALAFDLCVFKSVHVDAIDTNSTILDISRRLFDEISQENVFLAGSRVDFSEIDIYDLPFADASFDFVMSRYVFQHLTQPLHAMRGIARVLKPGGYICVVDIDDQLSVTYPEDPGSMKRLTEAFRSLQAKMGGDRFVGRKLASYMRDAGLEVVGTIVQPQAHFGLRAPDEVGARLELARFRDVRDSVVTEGIMSAEEYDMDLKALESAMGTWQYQMNGQMITVGRAL